MIGGVGRLNGRPVTILATNKGRDMAEGQATHFGGVSPDGYRKAIRLMKQSTKFNRPIVALINTPGAYPGVEAEYGGQGEAIARSIQTGLGQPVPYLSLIFGEAGSGGAWHLQRVMKFGCLKKYLLGGVTGRVRVDFMAGWETGRPSCGEDEAHA